MRYSENRFALHMVFKQGEQAKTIPYMLCAKARTEPIPRVVVRLRETSVINASTIGNGGPSPYLQLIVILSLKPMYTPRNEHQACEKVQDLSLDELVVADLDYIRHTSIIGVHIIFYQVIVVVIGITP